MFPKIKIFHFSRPEDPSADYVVIRIVSDSDLFRPGGGSGPLNVNYFVFSEHPVSHRVKRYSSSPSLKCLFPDVIEEFFPRLPD